MKHQFFGKNISPSCSYCEKGERAADGETILCERKGVVSPLSSCRRFKYDPLKRVPPSAPVLPKFQASDFSLEPEETKDQTGGFQTL